VRPTDAIARSAEALYDSLAALRVRPPSADTGDRPDVRYVASATAHNRDRRSPKNQPVVCALLPQA
jgi:hypothetical protein